MKQGIIEKYDKPFEYAGAFMLLVIAYQYFTLWVHPNPNNAVKIADLAVLMAFEFVMVHSGIFMALLPKMVSIFILIPFYSLFAFAMNKSVSDYSILMIYSLVVFNRMRFAFSKPSPPIRARQIYKSLFSVLVYIVPLIVLAIGAEFVPELGLNKAFLNSIDYYQNLKSSGLFVEEPHFAIVFGLLYYTVLAFLEVYFVNKDFSKFN